MDENLEAAKSLLNLADEASLRDIHALASSAAQRAQAHALVAICERLDRLVEQLTPIQAELSEVKVSGRFCEACAEGDVELGPQHTVDCGKYVPF